MQKDQKNLQVAISNGLDFAKNELDCGRFENALSWLADIQILFVGYVMKERAVEFSNRIANYYRAYDNWAYQFQRK